MAEEALKNLEHGLNSLERSREGDEKMRGDVSQLRSEFNLQVVCCLGELWVRPTV